MLSFATNPLTNTILLESVVRSYTLVSDTAVKVRRAGVIEPVVELDTTV